MTYPAQKSVRFGQMEPMSHLRNSKLPWWRLPPQTSPNIITLHLPMSS